jgi:hypothetical protein
MTNGQKNFAIGIGVFATLALVDNSYARELSPLLRYPGILLLSLFNCWWAMKFMSWLCNDKARTQDLEEKERLAGQSNGG